MTKPMEELQKIASALQALVGNRAEFELFQDPATHTAALKVEQESQFAALVILTTTDIRRLPLTLTMLLADDPETVTCETPRDLDEALANFVASAGMHQLLSGIMAQ